MSELASKYALRITPERLAKLRAIIAATTKGPWVTNFGRNNSAYVVGPSSNPVIPDPDVVATTRYSDRLMPDDNANMEFVAQAHEALPDALDDCVDLLAQLKAKDEEIALWKTTAAHEVEIANEYRQAVIAITAELKRLRTGEQEA